MNPHTRTAVAALKALEAENAELREQLATAAEMVHVRTIEVHALLRLIELHRMLPARLPIDATLAEAMEAAA